MSIPPDFRWRGVASYFPLPVDEAHMQEAEVYVAFLDEFNPGHDIVYRSGIENHDLTHHVFRWDRTHYEVIFQNGFQVRRQEGTSNEIFFNLDHYVHHGGRPLDSRTDALLATPCSQPPNPDDVVYRYEIYAPGGIWVAQTLGTSYQYPSPDEVCFVAGIATQYIRSAHRFRLVTEAGSRYSRWVRIDTEVILNRNFNPELYIITIQRPVCYYMTTDHRTARLTNRTWPSSQREKRQVSINSATNDWYADGVLNSESYIDAAFRSSRTNEVYLFMKNEYVLLNYAPGTTDDKVLNRPLLICDGYPSLTCTAFAEHGIDCAFRSAWEEEAFIFSGKLCAVIIYAPGTLDDKIKKGPMTIVAMFPFLKGTVFESGVDAAFESTTEPEAYLFKGNQYALINYSPNSRLIDSRLITEGFPSLRSTIFESGIDAAFASYRYNEAYIFKGDSYARINFAPGPTNDYIIGGKNKILPNWPSLRSILPRKNGGLDIHAHSTEAGDRDQDEL